MDGRVGRSYHPAAAERTLDSTSGVSRQGFLSLTAIVGVAWGSNEDGNSCGLERR